MCDPARSASLLKEVGKMAPYHMTSNHTIATYTSAILDVPQMVCYLVEEIQLLSSIEGEHPP